MDQLIYIDNYDNECRKLISQYINNQVQKESLESSMKSINIIEQKNGEIYCIVDPLECVNQAYQINYQNLIQCKYCKSITIPALKSHKYQCPICRCYTDIPQDYSAIVPVTVPNFILTNQPEINKNNSKSIAKNKPKTKQHRFRLLILCQAKLDQNFRQGLQCLQSIFMNYQNMDICFITYGSQIRLIQLQEDGRVITIHYESFQLINDKFYPVSKQSIDQFFKILEEDNLDHKVVINGTKLMVEILEKLQHSNLIVLWIGNLNQSMQFYTYPSYINTDIYCILRVPYSVNNHSQMHALQKLNINSTRVKYILRTDSPSTVLSKVYYQLYQIFQYETVTNYRVQASRQRKYPPEILTCKSRVIGSLRNQVIIKMGKNIELKQKAQLRIRFSYILDQQEQEKQQEKSQQNQSTSQSAQLLKLNQKKQKILLININFDSIPTQPNAQLYRYLQLYLFMKNFNLSSTIHQINNMQINTDNDIDLRHFWKDSSFMQRAEILVNLQNQHCIYAVWPLIGMSPIKKTVKFIYYFTGYHISSRQAQRKLQKQQIENSYYKKQIQQLNQLCQILYCRYDKHPPISYENMIQQLNESGHLNESDEEQNDEQDNERIKEKSMKRYYEVVIK